MATYLDTHIPTFSSLFSELDSATSQLKSQTDNLNESLLTIQSQRSQSQKSSIDALKSLFATWSVNTHSIVNSSKDDQFDQLKHEFNTAKQHLFKEFPTIEKDLPRLVTLLDHEFTILLNLVHCYQSFGLVKEVRGIEQKLKTINLSKNFPAAQELLTKSNELDLKLRELAKPTKSSSSRTKNDTVKSIAIKTLTFIQENIRKPVQSHVQKEVEEFLKLQKWPTQTISSSEYEKFDSLFVKLLNTEPIKPYQLYPIIYTKEKNSYGYPLTSFKALTDPIMLRFKFHFESTNSVTNRLDKPEWVYSHFISVVEGHLDFLLDCVQPSLNSSFINLHSTIPRNSVHEFISSLLPTIHNKSITLFSQTNHEHQLLSHLVYETVSFDNQLKEKFYYKPYELVVSGNKREWSGVAGDVLSVKSVDKDGEDGKDNFQVWLDVETKSALNRYNEIINSPNAFKLDYEYSSVPASSSALASSETKTTFSAINLRDLVSSLTSHYSSLTSTKFRLRYFVSVQLMLLDKFYSRMDESLSAFETIFSSTNTSLSSSLSNSLSASGAIVTNEEREVVKGVSGVERLARVIGSLEYIEKGLQVWAEDEFYLQLWEDITSRTQKPDSKDGKQGDTSEVDKFLSGENVLDNSTLFDETIMSYKRLTNRGEELVIKVVRKEVGGSLREYYKKNWATPSSFSSNSHGDDDDDDDTTNNNNINEPTVSKELTPVFRTLLPLITFLKSFYSSFEYIKFIRKVSAQVIEPLLWQNIITACTFCGLGGKQLLVDVEKIGEVLGNGNGSSSSVSLGSGMRRLEEAAKILALPNSNDLKRSRTGTGDEITIQEAYKMVKSGNPESLNELKRKVGIRRVGDLEVEGLVMRRVDKKQV